MQTNNNVTIFDTTLRDGEQSPGASMTKEQKIRIAHKLSALGVDVIEAGFANASVGDFEAVRSVAQQVKNARICSLARAIGTDIDRAGEALRQAEAARIHVFIASSPIHMQYKLKMTADQVVDQAVFAVKRARNMCDDVEFSAEDAGRSDFDFLVRLLTAAIQAGAGTVNIPDTVGYALPHQFGETVRKLIAAIPNADKVVFSTHCHNDLGLAVANTLAAIDAGARQIEATINGIGERAGNAALEEVVMALRTRKDHFGLTTNIDTTQIVSTSKLISQITGYAVQPNKAIVGANAFAHEAGIHQDGVLKHRETYEIMEAKDVGWNANKLVLGKHSGRRALLDRLQRLGVQVNAEQMGELFVRFKALADKKHDIYDEDLFALLSDNEPYQDQITLKDVAITSKLNGVATANVAIFWEDELYQQQATGNGPVDALFKAIEKIMNSGAELKLFSINATTDESESQGEASVRLENAGRIVNGVAADTDIVIAAGKAYISALNALAVPKILCPPTV